jgi:hypothetical protein
VRKHLLTLAILAAVAAGCGTLPIAGSPFELKAEVTQTLLGWHDAGTE